MKHQHEQDADAPQPVDHSLEQAESADVARFLKEYGRPAAMALGLALAVFLAILLHRSRTEQAAAEADRLLMSGDADQLTALIAQYPKTPAAAAARLSLARTSYFDGEFEAALGAYRAFAEEQADHPMRPAAELNAAICLEALDRVDEAREAFAAFSRAHPDHPLAAQALFGTARLLEREGKYAEARAMYEDFRAAHPDSAWNRIAEASVQSLDRSLRAARAATAEPAASAPAPAEPDTAAPESAEAAAPAEPAGEG
jgi:TolA-binding protein